MISKVCVLPDFHITDMISVLTCFDMMLASDMGKKKRYLVFFFCAQPNYLSLFFWLDYLLRKRLYNYGNTEIRN